MTLGNSNKNSRDYSKESLFVKFDPLLGKQSLPTGPRIETNHNTKLQQLQEVNEKSSSELLNVSSISMSDNNQSDKEVNCTTVSASETQEKTPTKNSAIEVLDRLISLTPTASPAPEPVKEVFTLFYYL